MLTRLVTAFSREGAEKVYVQHRLAAAAEEVGALLAAPGSRVFVCGDGARMAKDVHEALARVLAEHGGAGGGVEGGAARLAEWAREGRYVRDIWS